MVVTFLFESMSFFFQRQITNNKNTLNICLAFPFINYYETTNINAMMLNEYAQFLAGNWQKKSLWNNQNFRFTTNLFYHRKWKTIWIDKMTKKNVASIGLQLTICMFMICCGIWKVSPIFEAYNLIQQLRTDEPVKAIKYQNEMNIPNTDTNAIANILLKRRYRHNNPTKMHATFCACECCACSCYRYLRTCIHFVLYLRQR